jgi:chlorite dismutase
MSSPLFARFAAGNSGPWAIERISPVVGESLPGAPQLAIIEERATAPPNNAIWVLSGVAGHVRYVNADERAALAAVQAGLGRPAATQAALIPIRKSAAWWDLAQDERRYIFEERSRHIRIGLEYLPAVARRLYHCRDLGEAFDFLTWFEYAPEQAEAFEELVRRLRETEEWSYIEREVDIRLQRIDGIAAREE